MGFFKIRGKDIRLKITGNPLKDAVKSHPTTLLSTLLNKSTPYSSIWLMLLLCLLLIITS